MTGCSSGSAVPGSASSLMVAHFSRRAAAAEAEVLNTGAGVAALHLAAGRLPALLGAAAEVGAEDVSDVGEGVVSRPRLAAQLPVLHPAHPAGHAAGPPHQQLAPALTLRLFSS